MRLLRLTPLILAFWLISPAFAAVTPTPIFPQAVKGPLAQISNGTGTTSITFITAGANGSIVKGITCSNTDSNPYTIQFNKVRSSTSYLMVTLTLAASAGSAAATVPLVVFGTGANTLGLPLDSEGNPFTYIESGDTINVNVTSTVTAAKLVSCYGVQSDF